MGEQALKSHMKGQKHKDRMPISTSIPSHFQLASSSKAETVQSISLTSTQTTIKEVLVKDNVLHAEIRWALKTVDSKYSQRSCDGAGNLFAVMFPDSEIAQNFKLARTK